MTLAPTDLADEQAQLRRAPSFVPLILDAMASRNLRLRGLTDLCGLNRSRLGTLLHRDPTKRSDMTLQELQLILDALRIDLMHAFVHLNARETMTEIDHSSRYASLLTMLAKLFCDLPRTVVMALEDVVEMDGTEVRPEWGPALQRALVKRLVHEIHAVTQRRALLSDFGVV